MPYVPVGIKETKKKKIMNSHNRPFLESFKAILIDFCVLKMKPTLKFVHLFTIFRKWDLKNTQGFEEKITIPHKVQVRREGLDIAYFVKFKEEFKD